MVMAGAETSSTTLIWAFSEMIKNPVVMAKAQLEVRETLKGKKTFEDIDTEELKYLKLVIKETLRGNNFEFIPFGAVRRMCPGKLSGLATVGHSLAKLLYHFDWKLLDGVSVDDFDMTEAEGVAACRKNDLCLITTPFDLS
ncbi:premnaspirodiene oxygenase-like [Solanum stenotomum]|uniref:premnaspirodiene oxygenase-like n=1 Tax=Solanum stenotomum TaxID=172797 RepID=UPI0020D01448|nr:premnaspirodiene oxygenase-like [Solanum stenotomum]